MKKLKTIRNLLVLLMVLAMSNNAWAQSNNIGQRGEESCKYEWWGKSGTNFNQNGGYAYYVKEEPYDPNDFANPKITDVIGWHNTTNTDSGNNTSANFHMAKVGGNVKIRNVYGGYSTNGDANNNVVIVNSGTFSGNVVGGYAYNTETAKNNKVTINGGNFTGKDKAVSGGQGKIATGNKVIINGGTIACEVNGGTGMENNGIVSGNTVTINGGKMSKSKIFGGNIGDTSYSGVISTNNTVNILTSISVTQLSGGIGATSKGNTLNLGATGITVGDNGVTHFQTIALTKDVALAEGATILSAKKFLNANGTNFSGTLDLSRAVGLSSGAPGTMTLLASETANNFSNLKLAYNAATQTMPVPITTEGVIYSSREEVNGNRNTFYSNENKVALMKDNKYVTFTAVLPHISYTDKTDAKAGEVTLYAQPTVSDTDAGYKVDKDAYNNVMLSLVDDFKKLTIVGSTWDTVNDNNGGTLGMTMPKTGINTLMFQETDNSGQYIAGRTFKVYDDGGKSGNYSNGCNGTLVITAPEGYIINVKSNSIALKQTDYMEFYDNNAASGSKLGAAYDGSTIDYTSSGNQMTLHFVSESSTAGNNAAGFDLTVTFVHLVALPSSLGNNATVIYFKSATMPTASDVSTFTTPAMWADAGDWIVAHIVPNDGYWTDGQLLKAMETTSAAALTRGQAIGAPQALTLLQADEYDAGGGTMKPRYDGAGWYYYQIPANHSFENGYISSTIDGEVPKMFDLSDDDASDGEVVVQEGSKVIVPNGEGWIAEITLDNVNFPFDGKIQKPAVTDITVKKSSNEIVTLTSGFDGLLIVGGTQKIGAYPHSESIDKLFEAKPCSWFKNYSNPNIVFNVTVPLTVDDNNAAKGTDGNPWLIYSVADMNLFAKCVNIGEYKFNGEFVTLTTDLAYDANTSADFQPIGSFDIPFLGSFDGRSKTISGVEYSNPNKLTSVGLFGFAGDYPSTAIIKDLTLSGCTFNGGCIALDDFYGGVLAGGLNGGVKVSNITVTGCEIIGAEKVGTPSVGGIVGDLSKNSMVTGCTVSGSTITNIVTDDGGMEGGYCMTGGIAGYIHESEVSNCNAIDCTISSGHSGIENRGNNTGGIVGSAPYAGIIKTNFVKGLTTIVDKICTAAYSKIGAIYGDNGYGGDMGASIVANNYYEKSVNVGHKNSASIDVTVLSGYTPRGVRAFVFDDTSGEPLSIDFKDITDNGSAMMYVKPATISLTEGSTSTATLVFDQATSGTDCYSISADGKTCYYAPGDNLTLSATYHKIVDGIRSFYEEPSVNVNDDESIDVVQLGLAEKGDEFTCIYGFEMPDNDAIVNEAIAKSDWFLIDSNNRKWMSFYHEWEATAPANYTVSDGSNVPGAAEYKTIKVFTITEIDANDGTFTTADLEGVCYHGLPTMFYCDGLLPARLKFSPNPNASTTITPATQFKGVAENTQLSGNGIYVMNGEGDFILAYDMTETLKAYKSYIDLGTIAGARLMNKGDVTSVRKLIPALSEAEGDWYLLDGRKLSGKPTRKGLYINNGVKVVIK